MSFTSIWTAPATPFVERLKRTGELVVMRVAHHLPKRLAYWSFIDTGVRYIKDDEIVPEVRYTDILQRIKL